MVSIPVRETQAGQVVAADPHYADHFAKTASYTVLKSDSGKAFSNKGAGGAIVFTLPAAQQGLWFLFAKATAQNLTITATGGAKINNSAANGTFADVTGGDAGFANTTVICIDGVNWYVQSNGTWATT